MKESYSKKRRDVGTDARLKNQYKIIQFIKDSPAKSILLGITGAIFLKNVLSPDHSSREVSANKEVEPKQANSQADNKTSAEQEARNQLQAAINLETQPAASVADQLRSLRTVLTDGLPQASAGVLQMPQEAAALNAPRAATTPNRSSLVAASSAGQDTELTVRLSDGPMAGAGAQDMAELQVRDPSGPTPDAMPAEASADWMDTLLGLLGLFAGRSALASSGSATAQTVGGFVIDGYISGATVYRDDGTGKPLGGITQTTDASGHYGALPDGPGKIVVVSNSTSIDQSTGKAFTTALTLYAPGSASVINPITTLIQNSVEHGKTLAEATAAVVKGLGLGAGIDYLNFDPISTFASATGTAQSDAFKVQLAATQIANLMITGAAAISMTGTGDNASGSKAVLDNLVSVVTSSSVKLDLSQESTLNSVFSGLNVSASAVSLIASANSVVGNTLQELYDVQSIIQGAVLEVASNPSANALTAFSALTELVSMVNNPDPTARQQVLKLALADSMDLGTGPNSHISYNATPLVRVSLSGVSGVVASDKIYLHEDVDNLSVFHEVTAADLALGYADIAFAGLPVRDGILISATVGHSSTKSFATGFTSITKSTPSVTQDANVDSAGYLSLNGKLAALAASSGVDAGSDNLGTLKLASDGSYTYSVSNTLARPLMAGEMHVDTFTVKFGSGNIVKTLSFSVAGKDDAAVIGLPTVSDVTDTQGVASLTATGTLSIVDPDHNQAGFQTTVKATSGNLGSLTLAADGSYTYTVDESKVQAMVDGDTVTDTFTVSSLDGTAQTIRFAIHGKNSAPFVTAGLLSATEDGNAVTFDALQGAKDVDRGATLQAVVNTSLLPAGVSYNAATHTFSVDPSHSAFQHLASGVTQDVLVVYAISDGLLSTPATLTLRITGTNDAPVVGTVAATATEAGAVVTIDALTNASDVDTGDVLSVVNVPTTLPAGVSYDASTHSFVIDPNVTQYDSLAAGQSVKVTVNYGVSDGTVTIAQTLRFTVNGTNDAPMVGTVAATATEAGAVVTIDALTNASDVDTGNVLSVVNVPTTLPAGVSYDASTHSFVIDPSVTQYDSLAAGQSAKVTVNYGVSDGTVTTAQTLTFTVNGTNDVATVSSATVALSEGDTVRDLSTSGTLTVTDSDAGQTQVKAQQVVGTYGTFQVGADGKWTYTANSAHDELTADQKVSDSMTVTSFDGTASGKVTVNITGTNDAPRVMAGAATAVEDGALVTFNALSAATDPEGASLSVVNLPTFYPDGVSYNAVTKTFSLDPSHASYQSLGLGETTTLSISYGVSDGVVTTPTTLTFTVQGANDAATISDPVATDVTDTATATTLTASGTLTVTDADQAQSSLRTTVSSATGNLGSLTVQASGSYTYSVAESRVQSLAADATQVDSFTIQSLDGTAKVLNFTIHGTNDAPVVGTLAASAAEGSAAVTIDALNTASDADAGTVLRVVNLPTSLPAGVSYNASSHSFTINPAVSTYDALAAGQSATLTVNYGVSDGTATTAQKLTFTITGTNDAPVVGTVATSANEAGASVTIDALTNASDVDNGNVLRVVNLPTPLPAGVSYSADTHSFTIDPSVAAYDDLAAGQSTTVTVTYGVSDGTATTAQTLTFTVNGTNDSASIGAPTVTDVTEDASVNPSDNLTAVGNISISDVDQGQSTFNTSVTPATGNLGALSLAAEGQYTYTVANSATQSLGGGVTKVDTFSITSADGTRKDVSFTVHGVNDAPTVTSGSASANEDGALVVFDALSGAGDADANTTLSAVVNMGSLPAGVSYNASNHTFSLNPQASVFQSLKQDETRDVVVSYGIADGVVTTPTQVTFTVTGTNDVATVSSPTVDMSVQSKNDPDHPGSTLPLSTQTLSGQLVINDADAGQSTFGQAWLGSGAPTGALSLANAATRTFDTTYGTFSIQANGAWTFVTNDAFKNLTSSNSFNDVLSVSSLDGTATSKITVHVDVTGDLPSVSTSIFQTSQALSTSGRLIATDSLASNLQVGTLSGTYGQLSVTNDGHWSYEASIAAYRNLPVGAVETDTFTLKNSAGTNIGTVTVKIVGTNEAPVVTASVASAAEDGALVTVDALAHATDGDAAFNGVTTGTTLSVVLPDALPLGVSYDASAHSFVLNPAHAAFQYLAAGQTTAVTVAYGVSDGMVTTPTTLTFTVTGVNDVATVSSVSVEKTEGNAATDLSASGKLTIADADAGQAYVVARNNVAGTYGTFAIDVNGNWTYTGNGAHNELAAGQQVSDSFTVTSQDGSGTGTVRVNITGTNDAPVVGVVATTATEAGGTVTIDALSTASDVDTGSVLSVVNLPNPLPAGVSYNATTHSFSMDPSVTAYDSLAAGQTARVTVSYGVSDGTATTAQTVTFTVNGTNDAPVVGTVAVTATEAGAVVTVDALSTATDVDAGTVLRVVNVPTTLPAGVSYDVISHSFSIDPTVAQYDTLAAGQNATVTVSYGVSDGTATTPQTVSFTINGTNDAPVVTAAVAAATEDGAAVVFNALAGVRDVDSGNVLSVVLPSTLPAGVSYDASTRSFSLDPANAVFQPLAQGTTTQVVVNYGVSDGTVTTPNTWTVTVTGVNDTATVSSYSESKTETNAAADLSTSGHITVTDVDTGQALAVARRDVAGSYGTFAIKANGDWTYIASSAHNELTAGQQVFDAFTVTSADGTATGTVRIKITGTNDAPVLSSSNPTSVDIMQGQAATANLMQIKATDADGPDSGIVFEFATHQAGDADYSQFTIDSKTGQINMLATGAQAIAADSTVTDYLFHVQAHDALGAISQTQTVDVHVNMAVHSDNTATLPGGIGDWDIAPVTKDQAGTTVSDGFLLISHADPLITIHLPANVNKLTFDGGGILRLSNDAGTALGHISDITEGSFAKHAINISPETTENTIIDILPNGDYTIVGASDSVYDKDLGTVDNYRRDVVSVDVNKAQSQFSLSADGQYVQMVLRDPTTNAITGTTLLRDIEAVQFKDATVLLAAGKGYLTEADAIANNDVSQSNVYIYEPLHSVYHPY